MKNILLILLLHGILHAQTAETNTAQSTNTAPAPAEPAEHEVYYEYYDYDEPEENGAEFDAIEDITSVYTNGGAFEVVTNISIIPAPPQITPLPDLEVISSILTPSNTNLNTLTNRFTTPYGGSDMMQAPESMHGVSVKRLATFTLVQH